MFVVGLGGPAASAQGASCTETATSLAEVRYWVSGLDAGSTVCLENGNYGRLTVSARKSKEEVTIRPVTPGGATLAGASLDGSNLALSSFVIKGDEVTVEPGSSGMTIIHNRITGGYFGVNAGPTTTTTVNDVNIVGNQFIGPFGEDAIRADRYHDGPDANSAGLYVLANEFTNIRENATTPTASSRCGSATTCTSWATTSMTTAARASSSRTRPAPWTRCGSTTTCSSATRSRAST